MPQFDFFSFFVQIFWFLAFACFLYLIHVKLLAKIASAMKLRTKLTTLRSSQIVQRKAIYNSILKRFNKLNS